MDGAYRTFGNLVDEKSVIVYGRYVNMLFESENMRTESTVKNARLEESVRYNKQLEKIIVDLKREALDLD